MRFHFSYPGQKAVWTLQLDSTSDKQVTLEQEKQTKDLLIIKNKMFAVVWKSVLLGITIKISTGFAKWDK